MTLLHLSKMQKSQARKTKKTNLQRIYHSKVYSSSTTRKRFRLSAANILNAGGRCSCYFVCRRDKKRWHGTCRQRDVGVLVASEARAARPRAVFHPADARRGASLRDRLAPQIAQEGHPRGRPAGDSRHRPLAQARAAAAFRDPEGDRTGLDRRPRQGAPRERRKRAQDLRVLPLAGGLGRAAGSGTSGSRRDLG